MSTAAASKLKAFVVLRAICIGGERVEPDSIVMLGPVLGAELKAANKVAPSTEDGTGAPAAPDHAVNKPAEPKPEVRTRAKPAPAPVPASAPATEAAAPAPAADPAA